MRSWEVDARVSNHDITTPSFGYAVFVNGPMLCMPYPLCSICLWHAKAQELDLRKCSYALQREGCWAARSISSGNDAKLHCKVVGAL